MEEQTTSTKEIIQLHAPGAIPGIPGEHGPGRYEVDWVARTVTPVDENGQPTPAQVEPESEPEQDQEATQPLEVPEQSQVEPTQQPEVQPEKTSTEESAQA